MNKLEENLLKDIVSCPQANCPSANGVCAKIIEFQKKSGLDYHLPEPWNGNLSKAKIIFFGANPGYTKNELYPSMANDYWLLPNKKLDWAKVADFFEHRFDSKYLYVKHPFDYGPVYIDDKTTKQCSRKKYGVKLTNGRYKVIGSNAYWGNMLKIAQKQLPALIGPNTPIPKRCADDFVITEIAHCKSSNTHDIDKNIIKRCSNKFLDRLLNLAKNARIIVAVGDDAATILDMRFSSSLPKDIVRYKKYDVYDSFTQKYYIYFKMYHPSKFGTTRQQKWDFTV